MTLEGAQHLRFVLDWVSRTQAELGLRGPGRDARRACGKGRGRVGRREEVTDEAPGLRALGVTDPGAQEVLVL